MHGSCLGRASIELIQRVGGVRSTLDKSRSASEDPRMAVGYLSENLCVSLHEAMVRPQPKATSGQGPRRRRDDRLGAIGPDLSSGVATAFDRLLQGRPHIRYSCCHGLYGRPWTWRTVRRLCFRAEQAKHPGVLRARTRVGLLGILSSGFLEFLGQRSVGASYALTFVCAFAFLAVLTFLMGMTLPLLTNIFSGAVHDFFRIVSLLCFVNTLGAATGAVVASYVIILLFGLRIAVYVAAAINIGIAVLIFLALRLRDARPVPATGRGGSRPSASPSAASGCMDCCGGTGAWKGRYSS